MLPTRVLNGWRTIGVGKVKGRTNILSIPAIQHDLGNGQPTSTTLQPTPSCYHPNSSYFPLALPPTSTRPSSSSPLIVCHRNLSTEMPKLSDEKAKFTPPDGLGLKVMWCCACVMYCVLMTCVKYCWIYEEMCVRLTALGLWTWVWAEGAAS